MKFEKKKKFGRVEDQRDYKFCLKLSFDYKIKELEQFMLL